MMNSRRLFMLYCYYGICFWILQTSALDSTCVLHDRRYDCNKRGSSFHSDHSTQTCKEITRNNRTGHICHLQNICWDPYRLKFVYYRDNKQASPWGYDSAQRHYAPLYDLQVSHLKITKFRGLYTHTGELPIIEVQSPLPVDAHFAAPPVHVYYDSFWAENYGHAIFDDILPVYSLMHHFYMITRQVQVLTLEDLARNLLKQSVRRKNKSIYIRGRRFLQEFFGYISDLAPIEMLKYPEQYNRQESLQLDSAGGLPYSVQSEDTSKFTCYRNLLIGHALTGLHYNQGRVVHQFIDALLTHAMTLSEAVTHAITESIQQQLVVVLQKRGRRKLLNLMAIVDFIKSSFQVAVEVIDPSQLSTVEQIQIAQRATVIITPEGGISFFCIFARIDATVIIPGHYELEDGGRIKHMEKFFWMDFDPVHVLYYYPNNETELFFDMKTKRPNRPLKSGEYRDYMSVRVDLTTFAPYIEGALHRAEHVFGLPHRSYVPTQPVNG